MRGASDLMEVWKIYVSRVIQNGAERGEDCPQPKNTEEDEEASPYFPKAHHGLTDKPAEQVSFAVHSRLWLIRGLKQLSFSNL